MKTPAFRSLLLAAALLGAASPRAIAQATPPDAPPKASGARTVRGVVYEDKNGNGLRDAGEPGVAGVRVSNQEEVVATGPDGAYELPATGDMIVFVVKPSGFGVPERKHHLRRFYYIHKPKGSPKLKFRGVPPTGPLPASVDFALRKVEEPDRFSVLVFGDTQPWGWREVRHLGHDIIEELIGTDAAFGITLGDIVFDNLSLLEPVAETTAALGIPWSYVLGNHDENYDAADDRHADETFERVFGPSYYSFDQGKVHFCVLDDVWWTGRRYRARFGARQLKWLANDLALVPEDRLVVLLMHIPVPLADDRAELYRLIAPRPHCVSVSAHTHFQQHGFLGKKEGFLGREPHHHFVAATACGSWWKGQPDERGIPHATMSDGAPNGYSIFTFDQNRYSIRFKAAGRSADYQMQISAPDAVAKKKVPSAWVYANVFAGSARSKVEMRVGSEGAWRAMETKAGVDPTYARVVRREARLDPPRRARLPRPTRTQHLWRARLPEGLGAGLHTIEVRTTDMFDQTYRAYRLIRITG